MESRFETLIANFDSVENLRRETWNGKQYIVAPLAMIPHGVMAGSKGPLYYPTEESKRTINAWDGEPIVVYHPTNPRTGNPISAKAPGVFQRSGIGMVRKPWHDGKSRAEGWFDVEATRNYDKKLSDSVKILPRLERGEPIELSTGLYTDNIDKPGSYNGQSYSAVATNHRPDHLAVLPDQKGACSINDGCGVGITNAFCATGPGGGVDDSCSPNGGGAGGVGVVPKEQVGKELKNLYEGASKAGQTYAQVDSFIKDNLAKMSVKEIKAAVEVMKPDSVVAKMSMPKDKLIEKVGTMIKDQMQAAFIAGIKTNQAGDDVTQEQFDLFVANLREQGVSEETIANCAGPGGKPGPCQSPQQMAKEQAAQQAAALAAVAKQAEGGQDAVTKPKEGPAVVKPEDKVGGKSAARTKPMVSAPTVKPEDKVGGKSAAVATTKPKEQPAVVKPEDKKGGKAATSKPVKAKAPAAVKQQAKPKSAPVKNLLDVWNSLGPGNHGLAKRSAHAEELSKAAEDMTVAISGDDDAGGHSAAADAHMEAALAHKAAFKEASQARSMGTEAPDYTKAGYHGNKADYHHQQAQTHGMTENSMTRDETIEFLTTNCDCWKGHDETLNGMSDDQLLMLSTAKQIADSAKAGELVGNAKKKSEDDSEMETNDGDEPAANQGKPMTREQWLAQAPPDVTENLQHAGRIVAREKQAIVKQLVANVADPKQKNLIGNKLMSKPLDELNEMLQLMPAPAINDFRDPVYAPAGIDFSAPVSNAGHFGGLTENEASNVLDLEGERAKLNKKTA